MAKKQNFKNFPRLMLYKTIIKYNPYLFGSNGDNCKQQTIPPKDGYADRILLFDDREVLSIN